MAVHELPFNSVNETYFRKNQTNASVQDSSKDMKHTDMKIQTIIPNQLDVMMSLQKQLAEKETEISNTIETHKQINDELSFNYMHVSLLYEESIKKGESKTHLLSTIITKNAQLDDQIQVCNDELLCVEQTCKELNEQVYQLQSQLHFAQENAQVCNDELVCVVQTREKLIEQVCQLQSQLQFEQENACNCQQYPPYNQGRARRARPWRH